MGGCREGAFCLGPEPSWRLEGPRQDQGRLSAPQCSPPGDQGTKANPFHPGCRTPGCPPAREPGPASNLDAGPRSTVPLAPRSLLGSPGFAQPPTQPSSGPHWSPSAPLTARLPPNAVRVGDLRRVRGAGAHGRATADRDSLSSRPSAAAGWPRGRRPQAWRGSKLLNPGVPRLPPATRENGRQRPEWGVRRRRDNGLFHS